jgi:hypothetical protein
LQWQATAQAEASVLKVNSIILADRWVKIDKELSLQLDTGKASVCRIWNKLGYLRVCSRFLLRQSTDMRSSTRQFVQNFWHFLMTVKFLAHIMTEDEMWLHHSKPETETVNGVASYEFFTAKEVQDCIFCRESYGNHFWNVEAFIPVDIMTKRTTINSEVSTQALQELHACLQHAQQHRNMHDVLLQHDNAQSCINL